MKLRTKIILGAGTVGFGMLLLKRKGQRDGRPHWDSSQGAIRATKLHPVQPVPSGGRSMASMLELATGTDWERAAASNDSAEAEVSGFGYQPNSRRHPRPSVRAYERQFGHETNDSS